MKKLISLALAGGMVLSLAACGSSASTAASTATESTSTAESTAESTASEGKQLKIAFFMYENSNTFTTYIRKGLENYGAENNVVVDSFDGKSDQSTQTDAITTTLAKGGYDLIVVNPVDSGAGETINNLCRQYDIPVIYADRAPDLVGGILDDYEQAYYVGLDWSDPVLCRPRWSTTLGPLIPPSWIRTATACCSTCCCRATLHSRTLSTVPRPSTSCLRAGLLTAL